MDSRTAQVTIVVAGKVVTMLILGEVLGGAISRPIAAWRRGRLNAETIEEAFDEHEKRISNLEEKEEGSQ